MKKLTEQQAARQIERRGGRYTKMNTCEGCRTPLGIDYFSLANGGTAKVPGGGCLCYLCASALDNLPDWVQREALEAARFKPLPRVPLRGRFYLDDSSEDGWQVVDSKWHGTIGHGAKTWAEGVARFARQYVTRWGDINFQKFPYSLETPLDMTVRGGCYCGQEHYIATETCPNNGSPLAGY